MLSIPGITPRKNNTGRLKHIDCQKARTIRNSTGIIAIIIMYTSLSMCHVAKPQFNAKCYLETSPWI